MGRKNQKMGEIAPRKGLLATAIVAFVVVLALYTGFVGGVDKLPKWLQPIASAIVPANSQKTGTGPDNSDSSIARETGTDPEKTGPVPTAKPAETGPVPTPAADEKTGPVPVPMNEKTGPVPVSEPGQTAKAATREQPARQEVKTEARHEETRPVPKGSYHATGRVIKLLADDDDGIRHQKFLMRLPDNSTLLVVHNVDLAPRLDDLAPGDTVEVCGEYVDNDKGGLVHWTHHVPPRSRHAAGWIKHAGRIYE